MGTNYYLKRIPTRQEVEKTKKLLDEGRIESYAGLFSYDPEKDMSAQDMICEMTKSIHIGKFSGGWEFCFRVNDEYYSKSFDDVYRFIGNAIQSGEWKFINEYGENIELDDFIQKVNKTKGGLNFKSNPSKYHFTEDYDTMSPDGSWWCSVDFC